MNINFYQSVKPLIALAPVMAPGGVLVLYCSCRDGLGTEDMLIPYEGAKDIEEVIDRLNADYRIQMDHALLLGKILLQGVRIVVATPKRRGVHIAEDVPGHGGITAGGPREGHEHGLTTRNPAVLFFPQAQRALSVLDHSIGKINPRI